MLTKEKQNISSWSKQRFALYNIRHLFFSRCFLVNSFGMRFQNRMVASVILIWLQVAWYKILDNLWILESLYNFERMSLRLGPIIANITYRFKLVLIPIPFVPLSRPITREEFVFFFGESLKHCCIRLKATFFFLSGYLRVSKKAEWPHSISAINTLTHFPSSIYCQHFLCRKCYRNNEMEQAILPWYRKAW